MKINVAKKMRRIVLKTTTIAGLISFSLIPFSSLGQVKEAAKPIENTLYSNPVFIGMLCTIFVLLAVILIFADVAKAAIRNKTEQEKKKASQLKDEIKVLGVLLIIALFPGISFGQEVEAVSQAVEKVSQPGYFGMDGLLFFSMSIFIAFELLVAWKFYSIAMQQLGTAERRRLAAAEKQKVLKTVKRPSMLDKLNASVSIEKEEDIMLDHNYDGIRELDNDLPPWWKYGFYLTIVVSVIYLLNYHVFGTGKLQEAEYQEQLAQGERDLEAYRKKAANLVDENNAELLTDDASIASGKSIFTTNCAACHGGAGEGGVGPNLTDDYWLHNGDVKDIFKTIKYGYPEKGMKSWQQDLGAKQIHEVSSYIKSLRGTNPANAKEKEGELYVETTAKDSTKAETAKL